MLIFLRALPELPLNHWPRFKAQGDLATLRFADSGINKNSTNMQMIELMIYHSLCSLNGINSETPWCN